MTDMSEVSRESMDVDVLIVGGGSAGLSAAIWLKELLKINSEKKSGTNNGMTEDPVIAVIEKSGEIGAHSFSGAVLDPVTLLEMLPNYRELGCPIESDVVEDAVYYLGQSSTFKLPFVPPPFKNKGKHIISLSKFNRWLGAQAESRGVLIFPGFAAVEALYDGDKVVGVRTGDKGRDKHGNPKANFEPGMDLRAKLTIFSEGTRGSLFRQVSNKFNLREGKNEEVFEEGVKEIIQLPEGRVKPGQVIHTMGFPLRQSIGGTFIYTVPGDRVVVGLVAYLDSKDPLLDPHRELQRLKTHPFFQNLLKDGKVVGYGGKTLPAGGWYSMPRLYHHGMLVCGDSASLVDVQKLKGIHLAMKSGMLAAQTAFEALMANDFSLDRLKKYETDLRASFVGQQLRRVRNFHQTLSRGFFASLPAIALQEVTGGRGLTDNMKTHRDAVTTKAVKEVWGENHRSNPETQIPKPDGKLFLDKLSSVYLTGTLHDEDSPNHLLLQNPKVCGEECAPKFDSPCVHFCPANVYEMVSDPSRPGLQKLMINFTNCIHCKTCDIKCPSDNILWTTPEGGGGPRYTET